MLIFCNILQTWIYVQNDFYSTNDLLKMFSVVIQSLFIIFNLISLSLGVMSIISLQLLPEDHYPDNWELRSILIYTILFVVVAKIGIIGSYFMCKLCLVLYSLIMLSLIIFNYITWFVFPKQALIEAPIEFVLATSMFDLLELICAIYLIFVIRNQQVLNRVTPVKTIDSLQLKV